MLYQCCAALCRAVRHTVRYDCCTARILVCIAGVEHGSSPLDKDQPFEVSAADCKCAHLAGCVQNFCPLFLPPPFWFWQTIRPLNPVARLCCWQSTRRSVRRGPAVHSTVGYKGRAGSAPCLRLQEFATVTVSAWTANASGMSQRRQGGVGARCEKSI